jgi:hypothetical protein
LNYTPHDDIPKDERKELSIKIGMAVLLGKKIYNIAELLDKEILNSLVGTNFNWLYDLLQALGSGNIEAFEKCQKDNAEIISKFENLTNASQEWELRMVKLRIIALLEHIFNLDKDERSVTYETI